jgi:purine/pyrimidine-nucleoside phosphorylase
MTDSFPKQIDQVSLVLKANVYFEGKVVSHSILFKDGSKKTVGVIYPGSFTFNTDAPERMDILAGSCRVRQKGQTSWTPYNAGASFKVPGKSAFDIAVDQGLAEYLCSFE